MKESLIKVGVVGLGYWGPNLVRNFGNIENCHLVAICDSEPKKLMPFQKEHIRLDLLQDFGDLLKKVDAVAIATPLPSHYELAKRALQEGKHVLVEKPFTKTIEQADELVKLARQSDLRLAVDFTFVHSPAVRLIKKMVETNEIGKMLYHESNRFSYGLQMNEATDVLSDLAVHDIAITNYLYNDPPTEVVSEGTKLPGRDGHVLAHVSLFYPNNFHAHFDVGWILPVKVRLSYLVGDMKMLIYDDQDSVEKIRVFDWDPRSQLDEARKYRARWDSRVGAMYSPNVPIEEALRLVCTDFINAIIDKRKPLTGGEEGLNVVKVLSAATESLNSGGRRIQICP